MFELIDDWGPEKIVIVSDQKTGMRGVLVIDNTARGMGKGGTRMQPTVSVAKIARLARVMTWKWAGVDLFYGGAKAGIQADPTSPDKEAILRSFVRKLSNEVPKEYVFGLDMGLTENDAAIIVDELGWGTSMGTPYELGGVPYDKLGITGFGVAEVVDQVAQMQKLKGASVAVQGFGAVGHATASRLAELGYPVVAISTAKGAIADPNGLNIPELMELRDQVGDSLVDHYPALRINPGDELFTEAEILVPAALQDVIDEDAANRLQAQLVVEGANLPTNEAAQKVLSNRGITVVPDFVANAGGVVAAAFAMDNRMSAFRAETANIFTSVSDKLRSNAETVLNFTSESDLTSHEAARQLSQERVLAAMRARGMVRR
ncbi:glutamate dehydrogenase [Corynebacterium glutamicum]|uniref:Glu/Leu/Phe/Val family dehydrogenase n=1 Tax=Corynebacterium glutamicum TaxID=1718 RepID=UPI00094A9984|nr:Glu/Leu/Phe/Val dehydrogenase dimerization domain-containing protein [Corynebacterium glutamicum]APT08579.1 glutamate dehydrogenase [Corynebacterium glutamicum]